MLWRLQLKPDRRCVVPTSCLLFYSIPTTLSQPTSGSIPEPNLRTICLLFTHCCISYTIDAGGNVVDRSSFQEFTPQEALQQSTCVWRSHIVDASFAHNVFHNHFLYFYGSHMKKLMESIDTRTRQLEVSLKSKGK